MFSSLRRKKRSFFRQNLPHTDFVQALGNEKKKKQCYPASVEVYTTVPNEIFLISNSHRVCVRKTSVLFRRNDSNFVTHDFFPRASYFCITFFATKINNICQNY